jgi:hypothetical protein
MLVNILRWIIFFPATILISFICDVVIKILIKFLASIHDNRNDFAKYLEDTDSDGLFLFTILEFLIPAFSQFIAVICGTYILPNRRKFGAIILLCSTIVLAILFLFTKYSNISVSISYTLGGIFAYFYLKGKDFRFLPNS